MGVLIKMHVTIKKIRNGIIGIIVGAVIGYLVIWPIWWLAGLVMVPLSSPDLAPVVRERFQGDPPFFQTHFWAILFLGFVGGAIGFQWDDLPARSKHRFGS